MREHFPENKNCGLYRTKYCETLHRGTCKGCPSETCSAETLKREIDIYESLLPEGGIARLAESKTCRFCKGEKKGERDGYAILFLAHPEPKHLSADTFGGKHEAIGAMIPLQLAICADCRKRFLLREYLPTALGVIGGISGLLLFARGKLHDMLAMQAMILPFAAWVALTATMILLGILAAGKQMKNAERSMICDILTHPSVVELLGKGWIPVAKERGAKLMFSKTLIRHGLGTYTEAKATEDAPKTSENQ